MTLDLSREALVGALRGVVDVVEARNTIPILSNVLLHAAAGRLTITATDLDRHASISVPAAGEIEVTIDARKLLAAVSSLKGERVAIGPASGRTMAVTLKSGRGVRTLSTLSAKDFPMRTAAAAAISYSLPAAALARLLTACSVGISADETRYYLNGVYLHRVDDQMVAVATDGLRLVRAITEAPESSEGVAQIIIPAKTVTLLRKALSKGGSVEIASTENVIDVTIGDFRLVSKTVDGSFPDYTRVIPAEGNARTRLSVSRDAIVDAVAGVASVVEAEGENKIRSVRLDFRTAPSMHEVSAKDQFGSSAEDEFEGALEGAPNVIGMNSKLLTTTLSVLADGATLTIAFADPAAPVRVTSDKDPDLTVVIMPMRI